MNLGTTAADGLAWILVLAAIVVVLGWYIVFVQRRHK
jgi:multisubunit Na+/H+ antiporter MnhC subunit